MPIDSFRPDNNIPTTALRDYDQKDILVPVSAYRTYVHANGVSTIGYPLSELDSDLSNGQPLAQLPPSLSAAGWCVLRRSYPNHYLVSWFSTTGEHMALIPKYALQDLCPPF